MMALLLVAALRSLVLATIVFLLLKLLRVRHPGVRKVAWASVLACAFLMPLLGGHLLHLNNQTLRLKPSLRAIGSHDPGQSVHVDRPGSSSLSVAWERSRLLAPGEQPVRFLGVLYLLGAGTLLLRFCIGSARATLLWKRSRQIDDALGSRIRISEEVLSPWTFGNSILLPADALEWPAAKLALVLAHERMHVEQRDFFLQSAVRFYTAIFWFSPLGWMLQKECARLGEQTSDYAALKCGIDPLVYAAMLVGFSGEVFPVGAVTMARSSGISHRIHLILEQGDFMTRFASPVRALLLTAAILPAALFMSTLSLKAEAARNLSQDGNQSNSGIAGGAGRVDGFATTIAGDRMPIVGLRKGSVSQVQVSSGSLTPARVRAIEEKLDTSFIAFSENGHDYVITDPQVVEQAMELFSSPAPKMEQGPVATPAAPPATELEAEQQKEIESLKRRLQSLNAASPLAVNAQSTAQQAAIRHKLEVLVGTAKQSGKVSPISL